jgi:hypothetical protein
VPSDELPSREIEFLSDLSNFGAELSRHSSTLAETVGTPKAVSLMLYQRLWGNYRAFETLKDSGHLLEANIIIRTAIEAAICLAANEKMGGGFYSLLLGDLAATLKKMVKLWRSLDATELVSAYEAQLRSPPAGTPDQPKTFIWEELAETAGQSVLYDRHRWLSATSAHVTGISLMRGVTVGEGSEELQAQWLGIEGTSSPLFMGCVFMFGAKLHAHVIAANALCESAEALDNRLKVLLGGRTSDS